MKQTKKLAIQGMTCQNCVRHVTSALSSVPGVHVVSTALGSAEIEYDPTQTPDARVLAAIQDAGYEASVGD